MKPTCFIKIDSKEAKQIPIFIENGVFKNLPELLKKHIKASKYVIITDSNTKELYGETLLKLLKNSGLRVAMITFKSGEKSKNIVTCQKIYESLLQKSYGRDSAILALGGGVVGDVAGFVASIYLRGIRFAQIPTTLLAMVDSAIGGKVGIDTSHGKNLIGSFWQPEAVFADIDCLKTLPKKELINGLMEITKIFLTSDKKSFNFIEKNLQNIQKYDAKLFKKIITKSAQLKIDIIAKDEQEKSIRKILNFGHTIGHAVEQITDYKISHGYAIGLGMIMESVISYNLGILSKKDAQTIMTVLKKILIKTPEIVKADYNIFKKIGIEKIIKQTAFDKKNINGQAHYILLKEIGKVYIKNDQFAHGVLSQVVKKSYNQLITKAL